MQVRVWYIYSKCVSALIYACTPASYDNQTYTCIRLPCLLRERVIFYFYMLIITEIKRQSTCHVNRTPISSAHEFQTKRNYRRCRDQVSVLDCTSARPYCAHSQIQKMAPAYQMTETKIKSKSANILKQPLSASLYK
jgi:hypothetical protein